MHDYSAILGGSPLSTACRETSDPTSDLPPDIRTYKSRFSVERFGTASPSLHSTGHDPAQSSFSSKHSLAPTRLFFTCLHPSSHKPCGIPSTHAFCFSRAEKKTGELKRVRTARTKEARRKHTSGSQSGGRFLEARFDRQTRSGGRSHTAGVTRTESSEQPRRQACIRLTYRTTTANGREQSRKMSSF